VQEGSVADVVQCKRHETLLDGHVHVGSLAHLSQEIAHALGVGLIVGGSNAHRHVEATAHVCVKAAQSCLSSITDKPRANATATRPQARYAGDRQCLVLRREPRQADAAGLTSLRAQAKAHRSSCTQPRAGSCAGAGTSANAESQARASRYGQRTPSHARSALAKPVACPAHSCSRAFPGAGPQRSPQRRHYVLIERANQQPGDIRATVAGSQTYRPLGAHASTNAITNAASLASAHAAFASLPTTGTRPADSDRSVAYLPEALRLCLTRQSGQAGTREARATRSGASEAATAAQHQALAVRAWAARATGGAPGHAVRPTSRARSPAGSAAGAESHRAAAGSRLTSSPTSAASACPS